MSADDPSAWKTFVGFALSGFGILAGYARWLNGRFDKKADKHAVNTELQRVHNELATQRSHIVTIFEQMRDAELRADERHRELLMHLLQGRKQQ